MMIEMHEWHARYVPVWLIEDILEAVEKSFRMFSTASDDERVQKRRT